MVEKLKKSGPPSKRAKLNKVLLTIRMNPGLLDMVKLGAEYHDVGYQLYLQWLVEATIKDEIRYYGWEALREHTIDVTKIPAHLENKDIIRLQRIAARRVKAGNKQRLAAKSNASPT